jgi:hypothetical protein
MEQSSDWIRDFKTMTELSTLGEGASGTVKLVQDPSNGDLIALQPLNQGTEISSDISDSFFCQLGTRTKISRVS